MISLLVALAFTCAERQFYLIAYLDAFKHDMPPTAIHFSTEDSWTKEQHEDILYIQQLAYLPMSEEKIQTLMLEFDCKTRKEI